MKALTLATLLFIYTPTSAQDSTYYHARPDSLVTANMRLSGENAQLKRNIEKRDNKLAGMVGIALLLIVLQAVGGLGK